MSIYSGPELLFIGICIGYVIRSFIIPGIERLMIKVVEGDNEQVKKAQNKKASQAN